MSHFFIRFFEDNYITILTLCSLFIVTLANPNFGKNIKSTLYIAIALLSVLTVSSFVDNDISMLSVTEITKTLSQMRSCASALGYALKPVTLALYSVMVFGIKKKKLIYYLMPAFINAIISLTSQWTHIIYFINTHHKWQRGNFWYIYFIVCAFYAIYFLTLAIKNRKNLIAADRISIIFITVTLSVASAIDILSATSYNTVTKAGVFCLSVFILSFQIGRGTRIIDLKNRQLENQKNALLNTQIQPHFIYNTLSVIQALCNENPVIAGKCIEDFSNYLRTNTELGAVEGVIPIEKEIEHTKLFSDLMILRYPELRVIYDIRDGNYSLPFLTLQPLVENAIRHGVRGMEGGCVSVSLSSEKDNKNNTVHLITVKDNGTGVSKSNKVFGEHKGIGLPNVKNRVEMLSKGTFNIDFTPTGTTASIKIP